MSDEPEPFEADEQLDSQITSALEVLSNTDAQNDDVSSANEFLLNLIDENLFYFLYFCITRVTLDDIPPNIQHLILILMRHALRPKMFRSSSDLLSCLQSNPNFDLILPIIDILMQLTFHHTQPPIKKAAAEALAQAYQVLHSHFSTFPDTFFAEYKNDPDESIIPVLSFFCDLLQSGYYQSNRTGYVDRFLVDIFSMILERMDQEFIDSHGIEELAPVLVLSLDTIQFMLKHVPFFFIENPPRRLYSFIVRAPTLLPIDNIDIFRRLMEIFEHVCETYIDDILLLPFYVDDSQSISDEATESETCLWHIIVSYVSNGLSCTDDFLLSVIEFWERVSAFEFDKIYKNAYDYFITADVFQPTNIRKPKMRPDSEPPPPRYTPVCLIKNLFTREQDLLDAIIGNIFNMDPEWTELGSPSMFAIPYTTEMALANIFALAPQLMQNTFPGVEEKLASDVWCDNYGALLMIEAMCRKRFTYSFVEQFTKSQMEVIVGLLKSPYKIVVGGATICLSSLLREYRGRILDPDLVLDVVIENFGAHTESKSEKLVQHDLKLLMVLASILPHTNVQRLFQLTEPIIVSLFDPELPPKLSDVSRKCMCEFASRLIENDETVSNIFGALVQQVDQFVQFMNSSVEDVSQYAYFLQMVCIPLVDFFVKFPDLSTPEKVTELLVTLLQFHDPFLYFIVYSCFCNMLIFAGTDLNFAVQGLLESAVGALNSEIPRLISIAAKMIGKVFLHTNVPETELATECVEKMLDLMHNPISDEGIRIYQQDILCALSEVMIGTNESFSEQYFHPFYEILVEMIEHRVNTEDQEEYESFIYTYEAIFSALLNLVKYQEKKDPEARDKQFIDFMKKIVFNKFLKQRIIDYEMYTHKNVLCSFFTFIENMPEVYRTKLNISLNNRNTQQILQYGYWSKWPDVSKIAGRVLDICYRA